MGLFAGGRTHLMGVSCHAMPSMSADGECAPSGGTVHLRGTIGAMETSRASRGASGYPRSVRTPRGEARRAELLAAVASDLRANGLADFSLRRAARAAGT